MKLAMLEFMFMFDPSTTWAHYYEFEQELTKFFNGKGMEAQIISTVTGQSGRHILYIKKKEMISIPKSVQKGRPKSVGSRLRGMGTKKLRAPAKNWLNKRKIRKEKGFAKVMKKAEG